jgi:hypothetical protein
MLTETKMGDEIQRLVSVFRTEMAAEQLKLKYSGSFIDFVRNVSRRRTRFSQKLENIRIENEGWSSVIAEADACEDQIARIAKETIEQVNNAGRGVIGAA